MKKILLMLLAVLCFFNRAYGTDGGAQLYAQPGLHINTATGANYTGSNVRLYHYATGTTNNLNCWANEDKTSACRSPEIDDWGTCDGTANDGRVDQMYCDGEYDFVFKNAADAATYATYTNQRVTKDTATMWEGNFGTSDMTCDADNPWQLYTKKDASGNFLELQTCDQVGPTRRSIISGIMDKWDTLSSYSDAGNGRLSAAITALGATTTTLVMDTADTVGVNVTVPANVHLFFLKGGILTIATTKTLTINGAMTSGPYQVFSLTGTGKVYLGPGHVAYPQWWGAVVDGATNDYTAINEALTSFSNISGRGEGRVVLTRGIFKYGTTLSIPVGVTFEGDSEADTILWYSGTGTAIESGGHYSTIKKFTLTSLDPATVNWMTLTLAGTGTGQTGIRLQHVNVKVEDVVISYFNKSTAGSEGIAIKTDGGNAFSNSIENCYLRYNFGGIELADIANDTIIEATHILDSTKFGILVGYDYNAGAQTGTTVENVRINKNHIEQVNNGSNEAISGNSYGIWLSRSAGVSIDGNYFESIEAASGSTAYAIYMHGVTDGTYLLNTTIMNNNISFPDSAGVTYYSLYGTKAYYGNIFGNHFHSTAGTVTLDSDFKYFTVGTNYFTGSPDSPYAYSNAASCIIWDLIHNKFFLSGDGDNNIDFLDRFRAKSFSARVTEAQGGIFNTAYKTATGTSGGGSATFDIAVSIPSGARLLGCQLRVNNLMAQTWSAAYITGATQSIAGAGQLAAVDTKVNTMFNETAATPITSATTNVRITADAGNFDAGDAITAVAYYEYFGAMNNN